MDTFRDKLKEMQQFFGLEESGELTPCTLAAMKRPRCGLSDVETFGETVKWKNKNLSYRITNYSPTMRPSQVKDAIRRAWKVWSDVTRLRFPRRSRSKADIMISFRIRDHEDEFTFDGKGGILAHAFQPGTGIGGDVHFDSEESWTVNSTGINLFAVAVHEFGHALGLQHSRDPGSAMYPAYNFVRLNEFELSYNDVRDVQEMYGESEISVKRPPPKTPEKCDPELSFDAVMTLQQELIFFKDRFMWRSHPNFHQIGITLITSLWKAVPSHINAAYETSENTILFFKGSQYWAVQQLEALHGFPKDISEFGFPQRVKAIDAVLHLQAERRTVFFTGNECWRYDEEQKQMAAGYPKPTAHEWAGVKTPLDAAVFHEGFVYFFSGHLQYKYDPIHKHVVQTMYANKWLQC
ncbi:matrix metalloproteinase-18 [Megalops cyprinoides]|uniref:matrix metalloproteinase-18 n=1 Tax=Megalops cyprinoides TaxID=118141 RepID=UPI001865065A|nr:matrix metalloproteinase-18 [Megalops cyprinoides]